jgi:hypothetical protein
MKTILTLKNTNFKIDPVNFQARIGDIAQHLLCFDSLILHSNSLSELPSLLDWLDPDSFLYLLKSDSLTFLLTDWNIAFTKIENKIVIPAIFVLDSNRERIDYNNQSTIEEKIANYFEESGKFRIDSTIENLIHEVAKKTSLNKITCQIFQTSFYKYISELQKQPLLREERILNSLILKSDGFTINNFYIEQNNYTIENLSSDLLKIAVDFFHFQTVTNDPNVVINNADLISAFEILKEDRIDFNGFEHLVKMNGLPLLCNYVYSGKISAHSILKTRTSESGKRFREWFNTIFKDSNPSNDDIIKNYIKEINKNHPSLSTSESFYRFLFSSITGIFSTPLGIIIGLIDFVVSRTNFYSWKPNIFLSEDYGNLVKHSLDDDFYIPVNVESIIARGYSLKKLTLNEVTINLELEKSKVEKFNLSYTKEKKDLQYFNELLPKLIETESEAEFFLKCENCSTINRLQSIKRKISTISCKSCMNAIYPLKYGV